MSATMARLGDRVLLEWSELHLALNMAKMAIAGFSSGGIEEAQYLIKKSRTKVQEEK